MSGLSAAATGAFAAPDRPRPVRPGEELPLGPLAAWLADHLPPLRGLPGLPGPPGLPAPAAPGGSAPPTLFVEQFPGGHSNLTYLVRIDGRELVLRRPPLGAGVKTAHDMGREHRVLSRLHRHYPKAPRALAACDDPAVIGSPFFVMERVTGIILRRPMIAGVSGVAGVAGVPDVAGISGDAAAAGAGAAVPPPRQLRALSEAAVDALAELHAIDVAAAGLADLGRPAGYAARQVSGWTERWQRAATDPVPEIDRAAAWLAENLPRRSPAEEDAAAAMLHNDFKHDNLVLTADLGAIVAVLDWEMATVGDPLMDLGTSLGYWLDPDDGEALRLLPVGLTALPGNLSRVEVVERYCRTTGRDGSQILFYYVFGLLKIAVIAQQIYYRFRRGLTRDERFAPLLEGVRLLGRTAAQAIGRRRIDRLWG
ncbi:MAG: phosphotransferase family protein [Acidobacteria bacterium]|nr:phosphotransferase family protein [Acidobacteriota bacterium]